MVHFTVQCAKIQKIGTLQHKKVVFAKKDFMMMAQMSYAYHVQKIAWDVLVSWKISAFNVIIQHTFWIIDVMLIVLRITISIWFHWHMWRCASFVFLIVYFVQCHKQFVRLVKCRIIKLQKIPHTQFALTPVHRLIFPQYKNNASDAVPHAIIVYPNINA